jgi:hypothetical protein
MQTGLLAIGPQRFPRVGRILSHGGIWVAVGMPFFFVLVYCVEVVIVPTLHITLRGPERVVHSGHVPANAREGTVNT